MISTLREGINKAGSRYVILALLGIFVFSGSGLFIGLWNRETKGTMAIVNGYPITEREFRNMVALYDSRVKELQQQFGQYAPMLLQQLGLSGNPSEIAFSALVQEKLLSGVSDKLKVKSFSPRYVGEKLSQRDFALNYLGSIVPPFLYSASGQFDTRALGNYLKRQGMTYEQFEQSVEAALKNMFVISLLESTGYVFDRTVKNTWLQNHSMRVFDVITLSIKDYGARLYKPGTVRKEDLNTYFVQANNKEKRYWTNELRSGRAYSFKASSYGLTISDAEAKKEYQDHKQRWPNKKFEEVKKDIEQNLMKRKFAQRFTADARRVIAQSEPKVTEDFVQRHKGILKTINPTSFNPADQVGSKLFAISGINKTTVALIGDEGYLITLESINERKQQKLEDIASQVEADYIHEKTLVSLAQELEAVLSKPSLEAFNEFARKNGFVAKKVTFNSEDKEAVKRLEKEELPLGRMQKMVKPGAIMVAGSGEDKMQVIALESITENRGEELTAKNIISITKKIKNEDMSFLINAFIASLQNNAIIEYKDIPKQ